MNIIVTGASGFIGSKLVNSLTLEGHKVYAVVHSDKSDVTSLRESGAEVIVCDMRDIINLDKKILEPMDSCVHLAWAGSYGSAKNNPYIQIDNVEGTLNLIETLSSMSVKKLICSGTIAEKEILRNFGTGSENLPKNYYAAAKVATHTMSEILCGKKGISLNWCYVSNSYGPGDKSTNFINSTITKMLDNKRASFSTGNQIYDFTYIDDVVDAIRGVLLNGVFGKTYYLGSSEPRPLKEYIKIIRDIIDTEIPLYLGEVPSSGSSLELSDYDISNLVKDTGYNPQYSFIEGIRLTIENLKDELKKN